MPEPITASSTPSLATTSAELALGASATGLIVKVLSMVNASPDFFDPPAVSNGCSDLLVEVFGEKGKHARSAIGVASLPGNWPIEIEVIAEITD